MNGVIKAVFLIINKTGIFTHQLAADPNLYLSRTKKKLSTSEEPNKAMLT